MSSMIMLSSEPWHEVPQCKVAWSCDRQCTVCQQCLTSLDQFVMGQQGQTDPAAVAAAFLNACIGLSYPLELCQDVAGSIQASRQGNYGKRTGALCARLGACLLGSSSNTTTCEYAVRSMSNFTMLQDTHDLCTAEGVRGGTAVTSDFNDTLEIRPGVVACTTDDDCPIGSSCDTGSAFVSYSCGCHDGYDTCLAQGACVKTCDREDIKDLLEETAKMVKGPVLHNIGFHPWYTA